MYKKILLAIMLLMPFQAGALILTVGSLDYDIVTVEGSYTDVQDQLIAQSWYTDNLLAYNLADVVEDAFGYPNVTLGADFSPLFAIEHPDPTSWQAWGATDLNSSPGNMGGAILPTVYTWAVLNAVPEPAMLGMMSLGLIGLLTMRRGRQRA